MDLKLSNNQLAKLQQVWAAGDQAWKVMRVQHRELKGHAQCCYCRKKYFSDSRGVYPQMLVVTAVCEDPDDHAHFYLCENGEACDYRAAVRS